MMTIPLLFRRHFQVAYVVDDIKLAVQSFQQHYGVIEWDVVDMSHFRNSGAISRFIAMSWIEDMMVELIEPDESVDSVYRDWKKDSGCSMRFHHLGFRVDGAEELEAAKRQFTSAGFPIVRDGSLGNMLDYAYADTRLELGHYYEFVHVKDEGQRFFDRIPVNSNER